eukprot:7515360-Karenia_brevis.AAC.1
MLEQAASKRQLVLKCLVVVREVPPHLIHSHPAVLGAAVFATRCTDPSYAYPVAAAGMLPEALPPLLLVEILVEVATQTQLGRAM